MISYIKTGIRWVRRNKLYSSLNIIGLAISLSFGLVMTSVLSDLLSYDSFHKNKDRIFRVITIRQHGQSPAREYASTSIKAADRIKADLPGIEKLTVLESGLNEDVSYNKNFITLKGYWTDDCFFDVFSFELTLGNPKTALKEPYSVVLTQSAANKLFQKNEAIGKSIMVGEVACQVTGIVEDPPKFSHMNFEFLASLATKDILETKNEERKNWSHISGSYTYLLIPTNQNLTAIQEGLDNICDTENINPEIPVIKLSLQPIKNIMLGMDLGNQIGPTIPVRIIWILGGLTLIVMLLACFNYASLSIGLSLQRLPEIGMRKANGASRMQIFRLLMTEAIIASMISFSIALILFMVFRRNSFLLGHHLSNIVTLSITPGLIAYFFILTFLVGFTCGFLPALALSGISIPMSIKGIASIKIFHFLNLRKTFITIQFTSALVLISLSVLTFVQYRSFLTMDTGFNPSNIINIEAPDNKADILASELRLIPEITDVCRSSSVINPNSYSLIPVASGTSSETKPVNYNVIDENYLRLLEFKFLAGRNFEKNLAHQAIVNEQFVKTFYTSDSAPIKALGEIIKVNGEDYQIAGVVRDFYYGGAGKIIGPYLFIHSENENQYISVKIQSKATGVWSKLENAWKKVDPLHPMKATNYEDQIADGYRVVLEIMGITGVFSIVAISLASIGLLGMVVFLTVSRKKEIGIRKVFGTPQWALIYLLSREFLILIAISLLLSMPLTFYIFNEIVFSGYAYRASISIIQILAGAGIVLSTALLIIGIQTYRIVKVNPLIALQGD